MKAFARFLGVLSLTAFCVACGGGGAGTPAPPAPSANANLGSLTLTGAVLEQAFDPNQTTYTALVGFLIDSIRPQPVGWGKHSAPQRIAKKGTDPFS